MAHVISIFILKGGTGKTFFTFNIGGFLADPRNNSMGNKKVLLIDCDPQGSLSKKFIPDIASFTPTLKNFFEDNSILKFDECILNVGKLKLAEGEKESIAKNFKNLDILPIKADSLSFFRKLDNEAIYKLADEIQEIQDSYDFILFDCTNQTEACFYMALIASDYVIIPITCDAEGLECYFTTRKKIDFVRQRMNPRLKVLGVIGNLFKEYRKKEKSFVNDVLPDKIQDDRFFKTVIKDLSAYKESVNERVPINLLEPPSSEAYKLFNNLINEIYGAI